MYPVRAVLDDPLSLSGNMNVLEGPQILFPRPDMPPTCREYRKERNSW